MAGMFAPAAQPDVVRAAQKDQQYLSIVTEALSSAVSGVTGQFQRLQWERETHVAAGVLYYTLTTGAGLQTPGEEYCDLLQITGGMPMEPSAARRAVLVALQSLAPYCMARWAPAMPDREDNGTWRDDSPTEMTSAATGPDVSRGLPPLPHQRLWQQVSRHAAEAWRWLNCYSGEAARLHLALFYIYGTYYEWPKRLAGIRYAFIGKTMEQRASYRMLGTLLFTQLAITASLGAIDALAKSLTPHRQRYGQGEHADKEGHAVLLQADYPHQQQGQTLQALLAGSPQQEHQQPPEGDVPSRKRCPLCLSQRQHPTSTPCGHLFCWNCIAQWCNKKPECPLCRSEVLTSDLVVVHAADM